MKVKKSKMKKEQPAPAKPVHLRDGKSVKKGETTVEGQPTGRNMGKNAKAGKPFQKRKKGGS